MTFSEKLKQAMQELHLNQRQVCGMNLIVCQKSKVDDWVDHMKTYYPEYRVMDLTKKREGVNFRTLVETKDLYDQNIQIVGVINYDLVFRRKYIAHITDFIVILL